MQLKRLWKLLEPLRPIYDAWMRFARVLGWVNTRLILAVVFFTMFVAYRFLLLLFRKDPLRRKLDPDAPSYWSEKEGGNTTIEDFRRQY